MARQSSDPTHSIGTAGIVRYGVLTAFCVAALVAYLGRNCIAVAEKTIRDDLQLSLEEMGWVMGAFFITYAGCQLPGGWLGHVWGSRRAITLYAVVWSVATAMMGLAGGFWSLVIARAIGGAAQAGLFPCSASTFGYWFPASRRGLPGGALASFMSIGGAVAVALTGWLLDHKVPWPWVFVICGLPGIPWAVWFYVWFRDRPEQHRSVNEAELLVIRETDSAPSEQRSAAKKPEPAPWRALCTSPSLGLICGQQFLRTFGYIFYASWFPTFLQETRGVPLAKSGYLTMLPLLAVVVGSPIGGVLVDWIWKRTGSRRLSRQGVAMLSMLGCGGLVLAAYFAHDTMTAVLLLTAGCFIAAFGGPCTYAITIDMGGEHVSTVFSIMNMTGNIGAAVCPVVVAWFVELTDGNWALVLVGFAVVYVAAALCWGLLNPAGTVYRRT